MTKKKKKKINQFHNVKNKLNMVKIHKVIKIILQLFQNQDVLNNIHEHQNVINQYQKEDLKVNIKHGDKQFIYLIILILMIIQVINKYYNNLNLKIVKIIILI